VERGQSEQIVPGGPAVGAGDEATGTVGVMSPARQKAPTAVLAAEMERRVGGLWHSRPPGSNQAVGEDTTPREADRD